MSQRAITIKDIASALNLSISTVSKALKGSYEISETVKELLALKVKPDAMLTASDRLSTTALSILSELKIKVPKQIALAGFTNSVNANVFDPPLTAVMQPAFEMGKTATEMLIQIIERKRAVIHFEKITFDTQLIVRESSMNRKLLYSMSDKE